MPDAQSLVQPLAAPMPQTTGGAPIPNTADGAAGGSPAPNSATPEGPAIPKELVKHPAFQALFSGAPPALSYHIKGFADRDERELFSKNKAFLQKAGISVYKSISGDRGVIFNALHVHPQDLYAADKMGKLDQIAPDFDVVNHAVAKSGISNPVLRVGHVPAAPPMSRSATIAPQSASQDALAQRVMGNQAPGPGQTPPVAPTLPASVQKRLLAERSANLTPGAPTAGQAPGQGRLLNSILKPVQ